MPTTRGQSVRLSVCPRCEYDLGALPARHRCPECGFLYDEGMFVLGGWHVPDVRRAAGRVGRMAVCFAGLLLVSGLTFRLPAAFLWWLALVAVVAFIAADGYVRRRHGGRTRALVRYLVTADGVSRLGSSAGRIYLWRNYSHVMLMPDGEGAFRLHLYPSWWRLFGPPFVNARLEGLESEAEAVRREIERRINRARRAEIEDRDPGGFIPD